MCVQEDDNTSCVVRLSQSLVSLQHNAPVNVEFRCNQSSMIVGVDVRVSTDSQPRDVVVYAHRWICRSPNVTHRRTARLRLPDHLAYRPAPDNHYSVHVRNASMDAWMVDPVAYADARTYRKFYDVATHRDRQVVGVTSPWKRPRHPDVKNKCPSWWESIRLQLPYRPTCPAEVGLYITCGANVIVTISRQPTRSLSIESRSRLSVTSVNIGVTNLMNSWAIC